MPLVLVHNDVVSNPAHQWDDVEGVHYHYPSKYRRLIKTGEPFVYYRGVHRSDGRRGPAEYVGKGRIGAIWQDPERKSAWYCAIEDFERFAEPVLAKIDGENREQIAPNLWRDGVRALAPEVYDQVIDEGRAALPSRPIPSPEEVALTAAESLIVPPKVGAPGGSLGGGGPRRLSKRAKQIGDWAEAAAVRWINKTVVGCTECVYRAAAGETPGWDFDYLDTDGVLQRVEVKGTTGAAFSGVDMTAGEMRAAELHRETYWLCLVANCETDKGVVQMIRDPAGSIAAGTWRAEPILYSVRFAP